MNKNVILTIIFSIVFCAIGLFAGKYFYEKEGSVTDCIDETVEKDNKPEEVVEEQQPVEEIVENQEEIPEEVIEAESSSSNKNSPAKLVSKNTTDCNNMMSKLNFSNDVKTFYCYIDLCSTNVNQIINYFRMDFDELVENIKSFPDSISDDIGLESIFNIKLSNGKIEIITDGDTSKKNTLSNINNVKTFRATFSVTDGNLLYILDNNGNVYEYEVDSKWEKASNKRLVYKDVKDFDVFEGNEYKKCTGPSEGQNIQIALHTNSGKTLFGSPF